MAIRIVRDRKTGQSKVQFILPDDIHAGPVSAVGTFNDWTPGRHRLDRRANGTRSITLADAPGTELRIRYLGSGGRWFDDPDAEGVDWDGGVVRA
jgi:hypothetical protein